MDIIRAALSERGLFLKPLTVSQPRLGKALLQPDDPDILAVATDAALPTSPFAGPTVREVIWGTDTQASLRELHDDLKRDLTTSRVAGPTNVNA